MKKKFLILALFLTPNFVFAQEVSGPMSLKQCLEYSLENNAALQKDRIGVEIANQSRREILGSLLPQVGASSQLTYNIQKTCFAMPNFVNSMMPAQMQDPNAAKYMTVTMGMDYSANWGVALTQQIINFSLFSAVNIAEAAEEMARMGEKADVDDVISKTATLYYNAQVLEYSLGLFDESLAVMDRTSKLMDANRELGIVRNVDADRITVTRSNLETEKQSLVQALDIQKNLLKLEMGFPMDRTLEIEPCSIDMLEDMIMFDSQPLFDVEEQTPFKMLQQQKLMLQQQRKAAVSEVLPALVFNANYSMNYMGDHFYGETYHHFPVSMLSLSLKMPLFTGMSKTAKIKKAGLELQKAEKDERMLVQSLTMGYNNAKMQMDQNRRSISSQKKNKDLALDVLRMTEANYNEGLASLSDVLSASSSLIQAQMNYINALSSSVKSYIDLKKANGTISDINK